MIVELFPRKTEPKYVKGDTDLNRYLTWKAANEDIDALRRAGYHGAKYLVLISLYDEMRKECKITYLKPHWSERDGRWADAYGFLHNAAEKPRDIKVLE